MRTDGIEMQVSLSFFNALSYTVFRARTATESTPAWACISSSFTKEEEGVNLLWLLYAGGQVRPVHSLAPHQRR